MNGSWQFSGPTPPLDEADQRWTEQVRPEGWRNPRPVGRYNLVVIGGGTAGLVTAAGAAGLQAKVALIERDRLGGDCLNAGCVPSKALLASAAAAAAVRGAAGFGVSVTSSSVDFPSVMRRMRALRADLSPHDSAARFRQLGVDVFFGEATFTGPDRIQVGDQELQFVRACVATGARAIVPPIAGLTRANCLTNETVFSLTELPRRLAVIGGGPIGCELAQAFARFGAQVVIIESAPRILGRESSEASRLVEMALRADGIDVVCNARLDRVERSPGSQILQLDVAGVLHPIETDAILAGVGRAPNVEQLGLDRAGVKWDPSRGVAVDDRLRTTNPRIYAAGDVCSQYRYTHAADAMARIVIQNALFQGGARLSALTIPRCTYTDPEVAHVGWSAADGNPPRRGIQTILVELDRTDRARLESQTAGFLQLHLHAHTDRIAGATLVARHAGDLIAPWISAMTLGWGLKKLGKTILPYPTQSELLRRAADAFQRERLTPGVKKLFALWHRWRRR
ncbi:MAG: mercuric reductase [Planctomycetes bacterium]|nr:mercuric reductase [Planctomycetota bacterium]